MRDGLVPFVNTHTLDVRPPEPTGPDPSREGTLGTPKTPTAAPQPINSTQHNHLAPHRRGGSVFHIRGPPSAPAVRPLRAPLPLPRPNGPVGLQPEQHLPPASLLAEVHQLQDRRCARCPATDPSAQSRRGARGLCCRYHCCARNTYSVRRDPGSLPHPTTVLRKLSLHSRSSSRGSTFPKLTRSWPFAASGALSAARRSSGCLSRYHPMQRAGPQLPYGVRTFTRRPRRAGWPVLPLTGRARGSL